VVSLREDTLYLASLDLWLDSMKRREISYVSHGHADHARPQNRIISTPETASVCRVRFSQTKPPNPARARKHPRTIFETHAYNEPWTMNDHELTLFSAGHILGSSQLMVAGPEGSFVYTGDFKLESSLTAVTAEVKRCDTVLMECTFGRSRYVFPPRAEVAGEIAAFARESLERDVTPMFLAYSLGKAQEAMAILGEAGIPIGVHPSVAEICAVYIEHGVALPPFVTIKDDERVDEPCALIWPPSGRPPPRVAHHRRTTTAFLTGWAIDNHGYRPSVDRMFPLSDHADFPSLLRYIELAEPKHVLLNHGPKTFVKDLRRRGIHADFLEPYGQLSMF
jgi:putative mRNA 3-end processing factor